MAKEDEVTLAALKGWTMLMEHCKTYEEAKEVLGLIDAVVERRWPPPTDQSDLEHLIRAVQAELRGGGGEP